MSSKSPGFRIPRQDLHTHVSDWVKTLEPPVESPPTPDLLLPTNPVPEFMESIGLAKVKTPHTLMPDLMHGDDLRTWDGKRLRLFLFRDKNLRSPFNGGHYPGPTIRIPRGAIVHAKTHGHRPPPHTIHWHGIESTPMNDGVGHCSFEIGNYTYQWQPNYIGTYFYHCHRNTVQHYKFGLYGLLLIEPPDAFERGPGKNPGGYPRRMAANLTKFPQFPGFVGKSLESGDPHAMTVPYAVEASWIFDDMDSRWLESMKDPRAAMAKVGPRPGENDRFAKGDLHDYNPDYFFVTGTGFPGRTQATLPVTKPVPAAINSGVSGMQISLRAKVHETVLVRMMCGAYSYINVSFPVDVVVIALDGRSLGIPPFDGYNSPFPLPAGTKLRLFTAQRKDVLIRSSTPVDSFAEVTFSDPRINQTVFTGKIPFTIQ